MAAERCSWRLTGHGKPGRAGPAAPPPRPRCTRMGCIGIQRRSERSGGPAMRRLQMLSVGRLAEISPCVRREGARREGATAGPAGPGERCPGVLETRAKEAKREAKSITPAIHLHTPPPVAQALPCSLFAWPTLPVHVHLLVSRWVLHWTLGALCFFLVSGVSGQNKCKTVQWQNFNWDRGRGAACGWGWGVGGQGAGPHGQGGKKAVRQKHGAIF